MIEIPSVPQRVFRILVSAPPFAEAEWTELDQVFDAVNRRFGGLVALEKIVSSNEKIALDAVIVLLRPRLADDPADSRLTRGKAASLSEAVDGRNPGVSLPDIFVFNYTEPGSFPDGGFGWDVRKQGFRSWFESKGGDYLVLETYASRAEFALLAERVVYAWLNRAGFAPPQPPPPPPVRVLEPVSQLELLGPPPGATDAIPEARPLAAPRAIVRSFFRRKDQTVAVEPERPAAEPEARSARDAPNLNDDAPLSETTDPAPLEPKAELAKMADKGVEADYADRRDHAPPVYDLFRIAPLERVEQASEQGRAPPEDASVDGVERYQPPAESFIDDAEPSPPTAEEAPIFAGGAEDAPDNRAPDNHAPAAAIDWAAPEDGGLLDANAEIAPVAETPEESSHEIVFTNDAASAPLPDDLLGFNDEKAEALSADQDAFSNEADETAPDEEPPRVDPALDASLAPPSSDEPPDAYAETDPAGAIAAAPEGSSHEIAFANDAAAAPLPDDVFGYKDVASEDAAAAALSASGDFLPNDGGDFIPAPVRYDPAQPFHYAEEPRGEAIFEPEPVSAPERVSAEEGASGPEIPPSDDAWPGAGEHGVATPAPAGRKIGVAVIGLSVLGVALLIFFGWRWHVAVVQRDEAARQAAEAAAKASDLVFQLSKKPEKAGAPADSDAIRESAEKLQNLLLDAAGTTPAERRAQAEMFLSSTNDLIKNNQFEDAANAALKARQIFQSLALAEPANRDWPEGLFVTNMKLGDILAAQGHFDDAAIAYGAASAISTALTPAIANEADRARRLTDGDYAMGAALANHGRRDQAIAAFQADLAIARQMAAKNSADPSWRLDIALAQEGLGKALIGNDKFDEASAAYREALAIRKALPKDGKNPASRADLAETLQKLGDLAVVQGHAEEGLADYREALALWKAMVQQEPGNLDYQASFAESHDNLGDVLAARGKLDEALTAYQEGTDIAAAMADKRPADVKWRRMMAIGDVKMGDLLLARKRSDDALTAYKDALAILNPLLQSEPQSVEWQGLLSADNERVGDLFAAEGHFESALAAYHDELTLLQGLSRAAPDNPSWRHALSECQLRMGAVLFEQGHLAEAINAHRESLTIVKAMVRTEPSDPNLQRDLLMDESKIGQLLMTQGSRPEALAAYRDAADVVKKLLANQRNDADLESTESMIDSNIGAILMSEGRRDEALVAYRDGFESAKQLAATDPRNNEWQTSLVIAYYNLAEAGEDSAANFSAALSILKRLDTAGSLPQEKRPLIAKVEAKLAALKRSAPAPVKRNPPAAAKRPPIPVKRHAPIY